MGVSFTHLTYLKVHEEYSTMAVTDEDLIAVARTANNIRELHITSRINKLLEGIGALVKFSRLSLEVLALDSPGPEPRQEYLDRCETFYNSIVHSPQLRRLHIPYLAIALEILVQGRNSWGGPVLLQLSSSLKRDFGGNVQSPGIFWQLLEQARSFTALCSQSGADRVKLDIYSGSYLFEPERSLVHGHFEKDDPDVPERGHWDVDLKASNKKIIWFSNHGSGNEQDFSFYITEEDLKDGWIDNYVLL